MKKTLAVLLAGILSLSLMAGCSNPATDDSSASGDTNGSSSTSGEAKADSDLKIMIVAKDLADPYCAWLIDMCEQRMQEEYPEIEYTIVDQQGDPALTQQFIDQALLEGYNSMVLHKTSGSQNTDDMLEAAAQEGLRVCVVNSVALDENGKYTDSVSSIAYAPEIDMGRMVGAYAAEHLPENAKVVVMMSTAGLFSSEQRRIGYQEALFDARPDIEILEEQNIEAWNKDIAVQTMEDWLQKYDDIDAVISMNDGMVLGAIEACKGAGRDISQMQFYGIDGLADGCLSIQEGEESASVLQDAAEMGYGAVDIAVGIARGEITTQQYFEIEPTLITPDNVEEFIEMHKETGVIS